MQPAYARSSDGRKMRTLLLLALLLVHLGKLSLGSSALLVNSDDDVAVWPQPQRMARSSCGGANASATWVELPGPISFAGPAALRGLFARYHSPDQPERSLLFRHGAPTTAHSSSTGTMITVGEDTATVSVTLGMNESYTLKIRGDEVSHSGAAIGIEAATQVGVVYALESLSQLITFDPATVRLF
eukprot:COSAG02_NODE_12114_length_1594_cov_1.320401_1_plen_186_part_00